MRAVVTAGGTSEPIDDVRVITNLSTGRFGTAIAGALAARGVEVTLLAGRSVARDEIDPRVRVVPFGSFAELSGAIDAEVARPPDLWFMAAAVSDYTPAPAAGKIRSDLDTLVLTLERTPKLLAGLRARCGPATRLVGFKLLSRVSPEELVATARRQITGNGLDWCVANDLAELGGGAHPVTLVSAGGPARRLEGARAVVAAGIVDAVLGPASPRLVAPAPEWGPGGGWVDRSAPDPASSVLLRAFPEIDGLWWSDDALVADPLRAGPDWPSGVPELGEAALAAVLRARAPGPGFAVAWPGGRVVVGVADAEVVHASWRAARAELGPLALPGGLRPVWAGGTLVGVAVALEDAEHGLGIAPWIAPTHRGRGVGDALARALDASGRRVVTRTEGGPGAWWAARGFREDGRSAGRSWWTPPSARTDLRPAASVCLLEPRGRRVLLGRRRTGPAAGAWAFPGGRCVPGESPLAAGLRELAEEARITVDAPIVDGTWSVPVGPDFRVTCTLVLAPRADPPTATAELEAAWIDLDAALALRPITAGTLRVLRALRARG